MQYAFNSDFHMIYDDFPKEPVDFLLLLVLNDWTNSCIC